MIRFIKRLIRPKKKIEAEHDDKLNRESALSAEMKKTQTDSIYKNELSNDRDGIVSYLDEIGLEYLDYRKFSGCLWIIGGEEIGKYMDTLKSNGVSLFYKPGIAKPITGGRDAWWTKDYLGSRKVLVENLEEERNSVIKDDDIQHSGQYSLSVIEDTREIDVDETKSEDNNGNSTIASEYNIDPRNYNNYMVSDLGFSVRTYNALNRLGKPIKTVEDLLNCSWKELVGIYGFGSKCSKEVKSAIETIIAERKDNKTQKNNLVNSQFGQYQSFFRGYIDDICAGNFGFIEAVHDEELLLLSNRIKRAYDELGGDFVKRICSESNQMQIAFAVINNFSDSFSCLNYQNTKIKQLLQQVPSERGNCPIQGFVTAYSKNDNTEQRLNEIIEKYCISSFNDLYNKVFSDDDYSYALLCDFIEWSSFNLENDIDDLVKRILKDEKQSFIIKSRAEGKSLKTLGDQLGLTRERIRQIENKVRKSFRNIINDNRLILKIYAIRNQDEVLTPVELQRYFGSETNLILYLLRTSEIPQYTYDKNLDVFVVCNAGLSERTQSYLESLPDSFSFKNRKTIVQKGVKEFDLVEEILDTAIAKEFKLTGKTYHRKRLKLSSIYAMILKTYYPEGIWVYGKIEMQGFRRHIQEDYGDINIPVNDRAIASRIMDIGVLCDKGTYKAKQKKYLSKELLNRIFDYIESNNSNVFFTNTIFTVFEDDLIEEGVINQYYLYGILHEVFGDRWIFRRNYISKDESETSFYNEIVRFINESKYPVTKKQIHEAFPGVSDVMISLSVTDPKVLNLFGKYVHTDNLKITKNDIDYLKTVTDSMTESCTACNSKSIYEYIQMRNPVFLTNNHIDSSFAMFSLLENKFGDSYSFSRPFIARKGVGIDNVSNLLQEAINNSDEIEIADIKAFARQHHLRIGSILDLVDACNDTHFLVNDHTFLNVNFIGVDEQIANTIEALVLKEIGYKDTVPIPELGCIVRFPKIDVRWNEWLIYCIIKKWGKHLEVGTSSNQFRYAVPLIAKKGELDESSFVGLSKENVGQVVLPDDLSDIDSLLLDLSEEDWGDQI